MNVCPDRADWDLPNNPHPIPEMGEAEAHMDLPDFALGKGNCTRDGVGVETTYRPQHVWSDGEFDAWSDIGLPTASWQNAASRMALFRSVNPSMKTRFLRVHSTITVCELPVKMEGGK